MRPALMFNPTHLQQHMQRCWQHACQSSNFLTGVPSQCGGLVLCCHSAGSGGGKALDMDGVRGAEQEHAAQNCEQVMCRDVVCSPGSHLG